MTTLKDIFINAGKENPAEYINKYFPHPCHFCKYEDEKGGDKCKEANCVKYIDETLQETIISEGEEDD